LLHKILGKVFYGNLAALRRYRRFCTIQALPPNCSRKTCARRSFRCKGRPWLSYLFVLSYVAIAAGAVTHADLLLERPVKLPFLNVELPLLAFFALAPFVVLIIHIYALMHFIMLGNKASRFHNELRRQLPAEGCNKDIRDKLRRLLPSNIFVQILAGPPGLRGGVSKSHH
jgi:hypothetical protein